MRRELRFSLRSQLKKQAEVRPKLSSIQRYNSENMQRLSLWDIQNITRSMLHDSKAHEHNMGIISNIKGKMYCLKLGEPRSSNDFSRFFYCRQFRMRKQKVQPLKDLSSNSNQIRKETNLPQI